MSITSGDSMSSGAQLHFDSQLRHIKWLVFDLDRTLLGPDRLLHDRTVQALRRATESGYDITFATGRPPRTTRPYIAQVDRKIAIISYNGGYVETSEGERLRNEWMEATAAVRVLDALRAGEPGGILMEVNDSYHFDAQTLFVERHLNRTIHKDFVVTFGQLDYLVREGVNKFLAIGNSDSISRTEQKLRTCAADQEIVRPVLYKEAGVDYIEVMPRGVNKKTGVDALLSRCGWRWGEGIAFGDADNDVEMMAAARYAVAVEDASERALAEADFIAGSARREGIAEWLEMFLDRVGDEQCRDEPARN